MARPNRPQLALLRGKRGPQVLEDWTKEFGDGDPELAKRYALALATFLGTEPAVEGEFEAFIGTFSPRTRRAYAYAITEFFEWLASEHARIVPPHSVTTLDAERYVEWLSDRTYSLESERLRDGDEPERLAIFETVEQLGSADISSIAPLLPRWMKETYPASPRDKTRINTAWLNKELGRMVLHDLLVRTPTMEELRREDPRLGIDVFVVEIPEGTSVRQVSIESIFQYALPKPRAVGRTTIALRLTALSSFWDVLTYGENIEGGGSILKYNVFKQIKKRVLRGLATEKREAAARANQLTPEIVEKLLAAADGPSLADKRNAALLWFLVLTGARVSEAVAIRRGTPPGAEEKRWPGWIDPTTEPVGVWLRRKGNKLQWLPFPPYALRALHAFQADLDGRKPKAGAQPFDADAPGYVQPESPKWRYQQLAEQDDAPLFPPVSFWGANSSWNYQEFKPNLPATRGGTSYTRPMTRHGVEKLLKRIAKKADLSIEDQAKVHAHAIRHFAATAMTAQGKPIREVQAILGHESITTTEKYIAEEKRPVALSGQNEILDYLAGDRPPEAVQPPVPRQPRVAIPREVIQTYAVAAEEVEAERPRRPRKPKKKPRPRKPEVEAEPSAERIQYLVEEFGPEEAERILSGKIPEPPSDEDIEEAVAAVSDLPTPEDIPAQSPVMPEPTAIVHETTEGPIEEIAGEDVPFEATAVRDGMSPGAPFDVYAAMEPTPNLTTDERLDQQETINFTAAAGRKKGETRLPTLYEKEKGKQMVQSNPFLRDHYDHWPEHYGLGEGSLLPWYARLPAKNGETEVTIFDPDTKEKQTVRMPPLPVLAPDQLYPETVQSRALFTALERLTRQWYKTAPSKVFGLRRWYATFTSMTTLLERKTLTRTDPRRPLGDTNPPARGPKGALIPKYNWVPFDSIAKVGEDIRAHDDAYLAQWFEQNSARFTTTVKALRQRIPRGGEFEDQAFKELLNQAALSAASVETIPDWFVAEDPVRQIYDNDPTEWDEFVKWIGAITGIKITRTREESRGEQKDFAEEQMKAKSEEARLLLEKYYEAVDELDKKKRTGEKIDPVDRAMLRGGQVYGERWEGILGQLAALGVPDPDQPQFTFKTVVEDGKKKEQRMRREERVALLLEEAFPDVEIRLTDPNILKSGVFDPDGLRIDRSAKTIKHTKKFRERFAKRYDDRDSECLMRRAARAMWEYVKRTRAEGREPEHSMVYAYMLAYIAWIFPCPPDIEKSMREHAGDLPAEEARAEWLVGLNRTLHADVMERLDDDETYGFPEGDRPLAVDIKNMFAAQDVQHGIVPLDRALQELAAAGGGMHTYGTGGTKKTKAEREAEETPAPGPVIIRLKGGVEVIQEPGEKPTTYFGGVESEEELKENARPRVLLSPNMYRRGLRYHANAERVLPSPLQMFAAMSVAY